MVLLSATKVKQARGLNKVLAKIGLVWQDMFMRIGAFEISEPVPQLREPHAIAMLRPWVDVGSVGTLTLTRLEQYFGAKEVGRLFRPGMFFDFTRYRPIVRYVEGRRVFIVPNSVIYYAQRQEGPDLMFLHLLEPHAFAEDYTESIVEVVKRFGVKRYCRVGSMYDAMPHTRPLLVTGSVTGEQIEDLAGKVNLRQSTYQGPTTIMNLVSEGVSNMKMENINLMVHVPQYVQLEEDYTGAARLLEVLCAIYNLPPDLPEFERGQRQYQELSGAIERNPELKALIRRMEAYYDTQVASQEEKAPPLSPEVEKFLREIDKKFDDPRN